MAERDPTAILRKGAAILAEKLGPLGFVFDIKTLERTSAGPAADGCFSSGDRRMLLSFRYSLGLVRYQKGAFELKHSQLMRALGLADIAKYPGFSDDPLDAFRDLRFDLDSCDAFLQNDGAAFVALAKNYVDPPHGLRGLTAYLRSQE